MMGERVALFLPSLHGGGAERVAVKLVKGLLEEGVKVDLVLARAEGPYLAELPKEDGFRLFDLKVPRVLYALPGLSRYLRHEHPLALLSFMNHANIVAIWAKKWSRYTGKLVVSERVFLSVNSQQTKGIKAKLIPYLVKKYYPAADRVVCVSMEVARDLKSLGVPEEKFVVIYNPVISQELFEKAKEPLDHPWFADGVPVILGAGRLSPQKDFPTLLKAFSLVRRRRRARVVILGEGEERERLRQLSEELGVAREVDFPGFDPNPYRWMKKAAVFVLSSRWEGLPGVLIEALALGTPVVATDCPSGPREILEDGKWGGVVPVGDAKAMAEAILETIEEGRRPFSEEFQAHLRKFSLKEVVKQYKNVLLGGI